MKSFGTAALMLFLFALGSMIIFSLGEDAETERETATGGTPGSYLAF